MKKLLLLFTVLVSTGTVYAKSELFGNELSNISRSSKSISKRSIKEDKTKTSSIVNSASHKKKILKKVNLRTRKAINLSDLNTKKYVNKLKSRKNIEIKATSSKELQKKIFFQRMSLNKITPVKKAISNARLTPSANLSKIPMLSEISANTIPVVSTSITSVITPVAVPVTTPALTRPVPPFVSPHSVAVTASVATPVISTASAIPTRRVGPPLPARPTATATASVATPVIPKTRPLPVPPKKATTTSASASGIPNAPPLPARPTATTTASVATPVISTASAIPTRRVGPPLPARPTATATASVATPVISKTRPLPVPPKKATTTSASASGIPNAPPLPARPTATVKPSVIPKASSLPFQPAEFQEAFKNLKATSIDVKNVKSTETFIFNNQLLTKIGNTSLDEGKWDSDEIKTTLSPKEKLDLEKKQQAEKLKKNQENELAKLDKEKEIAKRKVPKKTEPEINNPAKAKPIIDAADSNNDLLLRKLATLRMVVENDEDEEEEEEEDFDFD